MACAFPFNVESPPCRRSTSVGFDSPSTFVVLCALRARTVHLTKVHRLSHDPPGQRSPALHRNDPKRFRCKIGTPSDGTQLLAGAAEKPKPPPLNELPLRPLKPICPGERTLAAAEHAPPAPIAVANPPAAPAQAAAAEPASESLAKRTTVRRRARSLKWVFQKTWPARCVTWAFRADASAAAGLPSGHCRSRPDRSVAHGLGQDRRIRHSVCAVGAGSRRRCQNGCPQVLVLDRRASSRCKLQTRLVALLPVASCRLLRSTAVRRWVVRSKRSRPARTWCRERRVACSITCDAAR